MRAALYARVSTPSQGEEDKVSIPEQIERMESYCEGNSHTVADRYVDIGYSGTTSKRPELQRMLTDAKSGKFEVVICWKADRLSRGMYPASALMEAIEPLGITIEAVEERFDMNTFALLAVVGKIELDNIKARTRMGQQGRAKRGRMQGSAPYGYFYSKETGRYEIDEEEAGVVRWIFDLYTQGTPIRQIVAKLNSLGILTKQNSKLGWTVPKVNDILNKAFYHGEGYYNQRASRITKSKLKPKEAWIALEYPAIISQETFKASQTRKQENKRFCAGRTKGMYLLQHLLFCEECGMRFYVATRNRSMKYRLADGTERIWERKRNLGHYVCRGTRDYPHIYNCRKPKQILCDEIEALVWGKVDEILRNPTALRLAIQTYSERVQTEIADESQYMKQVVAKIDKAKLEEQWLITQARKGQITEEQMSLQLKAVREEREAWEAEVRKIEQVKVLRAKEKDVLEQAQKVCSELVARLDHLGNSNSREVKEQKQAIARLLLNRVTVDRNGQVTIEFGVPELVEPSEAIVAFEAIPPQRGGWH